MQYKLTIYEYVKKPWSPDEAVPDTFLDHRELASYHFDDPPWVPREGEFVRFRDPYRNGGPGTPDHNEVSGWVEDVVTVWYGSMAVIELYIRSREVFGDDARPLNKPAKVSGQVPR